MILEICAGSWDSVLAAKRGGAHRVELCSGLDEGGLTPSWGLIDKVCGLEGIQKHVLIRPRGGDFLYSDDEKEIILRDIEMARSLHATVWWLVRCWLTETSIWIFCTSVWLRLRV